MQIDGQRNLADQFAIVGVGVVMGHTLPDPGKFTARALEAEAARRAIADAGIRREDIGGAISATRDAGPRERPNHVDAFPRVLALPVNFFFEVKRGGAPGIWALMAAMPYLEYGLADYVIVAGGVEDWSRMRRRRESGQILHGPGLTWKEGAWGGTFGGVHASSFHSFFAARHMHEFGTTSQQLGAVAVQTRQWAAMNPEARMFGRPITLDDHQNSELVVEPYRRLDMCLISDGAIAFVVTRADRARSGARPPVFIGGVGFGEHMQDMWWTKENYTRLPVETAKQSAFGMAGITLEDVDLAQLYDCFTAEVVLQLEDYGWCDKGQGGQFVAAGNIGPGGKIPVNTYGGLLGAYHLADLGGIAEAVVQLRGEAGERQVDDARYCLVTGHGGEVVEPMCSLHACVVFHN